MSRNHVVAVTFQRIRQSCGQVGVQQEAERHPAEKPAREGRWDPHRKTCLQATHRNPAWAKCVSKANTRFTPRWRISVKLT